MPQYHLQITDGREAEVTIEVDNAAEAMNSAFNAMSMFACRNFPPPDLVIISVEDETRAMVGIIRMTFEIEMAAPATS